MALVRRATVALLLAACGPDAVAPPNPAAAACVAHRAAQELACVDRHETRPAIDACRATVRGAIDCAPLDDAGTR